MNVTDRQRAVLRAVALKAPGWYRAGESGQGSSGGERVTLASLYRAGLCKRRVWRQGREAMIAALGARPVEVLTEERLRAAMYTALPGDGDGAGVLFACLTSSGPVALPTPVDREALIEARETMATWPRRAIDDRAIAALDAILAAPVAPSPAPVEAGPRYVDTSGPRYVVTTTARASIPADREAKAMNEGGRAFYPYLYGEQPNQETYPAAIVDILGGAK